MTNRTMTTLYLMLIVGAIFLGGCDRIVYLGDDQLADQVRPPGDSFMVDPPKAGEHYLGAFHPDAPFDSSHVDEFTNVVGKQPAIMMWYQPWGTDGRSAFSFAAVSELQSRGIVPMVSWEPWNPPDDPRSLENPQINEKFRLRNISGGDFDTYIRGWARDVRELSGPIMIRPMHEMNGNWYPWGGTANGNRPGDFVSAWHHIHDIFEEEGANNVSWVWSVNLESVPDNKENAYDIYYPGDPYVDWIGISGFNYGDTETWSVWTRMTDLYREGLSSLGKYNKPLMLAEVSSVESGGDKGEWFTDAFSTLRNEHPNIGAVVWYDAIDEDKDFRITSSFEATQVFRQEVSQDWVLSAAQITTIEGGVE